MAIEPAPTERTAGGDFLQFGKEQNPERIEKSLKDGSGFRLSVWFMAC